MGGEFYLAAAVSIVVLHYSSEKCFLSERTGNNLTLWHMLIAWVAYTRLNDAQDKSIWGLLQNGTFTVNSMFKALITDT
jgi:hypothetical protein